MTVGHKNTFAIEYSFDKKYPKTMGYGKIWVNNKFIGTEHDLIYLNGYLLGTLDSISEAKELTSELIELTKDKLFDTLENPEQSYNSRHRVSNYTFTDDFSIWAYKTDKEIVLLWKVLRNNSFKDLSNYPHTVMQERIDSKTFDSVLNQLKFEFTEHGVLTK